MPEFLWYGKKSIKNYATYAELAHRAQKSTKMRITGVVTTVDFAKR